MGLGGVRAAFVGRGGGRRKVCGAPNGTRRGGDRGGGQAKRVLVSPTGPRRYHARPTHGDTVSSMSASRVSIWETVSPCRHARVRHVDQLPILGDAARRRGDMVSPSIGRRSTRVDTVSPPRDPRPIPGGPRSSGRGRASTERVFTHRERRMEGGGRSLPGQPAPQCGIKCPNHAPANTRCRRSRRRDSARATEAPARAQCADRPRTGERRRDTRRARCRSRSRATRGTRRRGRHG